MSVLWVLVILFATPAGPGRLEFEAPDKVVCEDWVGRIKGNPSFPKDATFACEIKT